MMPASGLLCYVLSSLGACCQHGMQVQVGFFEQVHHHRPALAQLSEGCMAGNLCWDPSGQG